jgi:anti-sigma-K factor RskA
VLWWAIAASVMLALAIPLLWNVRRDRDALRAELMQARSASTAEAARLRDSLADNAAVLGALTGPGVRVVELVSSAPSRPRGRMFWDQVAGRWTFVAHDLPALDPGRTYQLWVITRAGARVSAGTFEPVDGRAIVQATYALDRDQLGAIAVTEEPAGGVPQPTGTIVIAGSPT